MAAVQTASRGLSTKDLEQIRDSLATGRKPKVMFTEAAGQIAGQAGQVVRLTDPALSDEWVVVRFGKDELPFAPTDIAVAPKVPARRAAAPVEAPDPASTPAAVAPADEPPVPREESPMPPSPASSTVDAPAKVNGAASAARKDAADKAAADKAAADKPDASAEARKASAPAVRKAGKPKAPPSLTVTLSYADGEWMVGATQGSKALAKPYVIKPADALKMVALLDVPGVHEAVEDIVSAARSEAEREAERLRTQLAEVEARLAELRETA